jgi:hypothetical protein
MRKCAFTFAITSARQLSEPFSLKCIGKHIQINDDFVQFVPSSLSKTDCAGHIGLPIRLKAWKEDTSIFPVALTRALLIERVNLDIRHDRLFFNIQRPDAEMSLESFRRCIRWCLQDAGIQALPGSTPATAATSAFGRGVAMADILHLGDWSSSSTFLRFYASSGQVSESAHREWGALLGQFQVLTVG